MNAARLYNCCGRRMFAVLVVLLCLAASGCSGITPDGEIRNNREEGPEKGIFSGSAGEFVLLGPAKIEPPAEKETQAEAPQ
ncbi:hypothetical protein [Desulfopila aestuarii]|uniref:Lipoprotein-attachment site-containing protein n=1 Tax=Desulfopila aestuarii DSM 18488 TaxID=1121416 RepID=A0A1M7YCN2_9BACT|nr:hypothetical protein [Desulfopila aestuarii]SHO50394.1 hypothetical protein SAMN02745220_03397 [Desulfopila aestuarii DSM 18488]